jgi:hypothetical protein
MKRLLIAVVLLVFVGGMITGCQVASKPRSMGKGIQSSEKAQGKWNHGQAVSLAEKQDSSQSCHSERIYLYAGSECTN